MTGSVSTLLVDTGADISIFKRLSVNPDQIVDFSRATSIKGITEDLTNSLGVANTNIFIQGCTLPHKFHIVDSNVPIPCDGILGRDFLVAYQSIIDYSNWNMTVHLKHKKLTIPILSSPEKNVYHIPSRCEVIREIDVLKHLTHDVVVLNKELKPGVYLARSIVSQKHPLVKILNTTFENVTVDISNLETISLDKFNIYNIETENQDRHVQLLKELNQDVPDFVKKDLLQLCEDYSDVFGLETDKLTFNNFYTQKLKVIDKKPIYIKNYRAPRALKDETNRQVEKLLHNNIIEPSCSAYNSPVLLVPKKSQTDQKAWRLCIDFRAVNKVLIGDKFPINRIDDILDQLGRAKWFSVVDLLSGFHQIPLDEESRDLTSFSSDKGSYRFTRLPFGLSVSPNSFQRMMSIAFAGITPEKAFLYMDDLIVIGCSEKHHLNNLKSVFETCRKYNLKLNPKKCNFFRKEVTFLGHKITDKGILPDETKYDIINKYPTPRAADEVKRFVAFCNYYRRFIPNFATITLPLNSLTKKNAEFVWSSECESSFNRLKQALISPRILQYPDFSKQFILVTDASQLACGAVLSQNFNGQELPIAYASRMFTKGESHKPTILKELTAIHWAIKYFRCYLYGQKFLVKTDHRPLVYLFSMKDPSSKLTRIRLDLEDFDFDIEYIKGTDNVGADALSRINISDLQEIRNTAQILAITRSMTKTNQNFNKHTTTGDKQLSRTEEPQIYEALNNYNVLKFPSLRFEIDKECIHIIINYRKKSARCWLSITNGNFSLPKLLSKLNNMAGDSKFTHLRLNLNDKIFTRCTVNELKEVGHKILSKVKIVLCKERKLIKDNDEKLNLIKQFHDDPMLGGHCGQKRLLKKLRSFYLWKNMSRDIAKYVRQCHKCQVNKAAVKHIEPLTLTPTPQKAFDIVCIDTIGPLQKSNHNNCYAVTLQCELTKYIVILPIPNKEASTVARAIFEKFILVYGPIKEVRTDLGTEYKNKIFESLAKMLNTPHKTSTAYHSQSIGGCERNHRVLNEFMRMYIDQAHTDWDIWTNYYTFCYNTTPSTYHNYTPFELVFGKRADLPEIFNGSRVDPLYNLESYDQEFRFRLQLAQNKARDFLEKTKQKRKLYYDQQTSRLQISPGDFVLITNEDRQKLDSWFDGPFEVILIEGPNCIVKDNNNKQIKVHKNRIKKYNVS